MMSRGVREGGIVGERCKESVDMGREVVVFVGEMRSGEKVMGVGDSVRILRYSCEGW